LRVAGVCGRIHAGLLLNISKNIKTKVKEKREKLKRREEFVFRSLYIPYMHQNTSDLYHSQTFISNETGMKHNL
jgi:hypothetical protein